MADLTTVRPWRIALLAALGACVFCATFAALSYQPALDFDRARGLYAAEGGAATFHWTASRAEFPLAPHTGTTRVRLVLSIAAWPRQPEVPVRIEADAGVLATVGVTAQPRRVELILPPGTTRLLLHSPVARPPGDWRWLGVQVQQIELEPAGFSLRALTLALLCAAVSIPLALALIWAIRHGYGPIAALMLLGLTLRLLWLGDSPPIMHRDETVAIVDAWNLVRTGRDHLGHLLPVAAFEGYGDWSSPMLTYLLLPWVALFGPQPIVARAVTAVFGALAIPAIYALVRELRLPAAAVWAAAVAALSPWQIFLSHVAIPPALVATTWALCVWAALRFVRDGQRRDGFWLAAAAGLALYAYPTLKLAVPLVLALAVALATARHGWRAPARWWAPALLLGALWLPFVASTLFNPTSGSRLALVALKADSPSTWLAAWWSNYTIYFQPNLYYFGGGVRKIVQGLPDHGVALGAEAFLLLGLAALPLLLLLDRRAGKPYISEDPAPAAVWILLIGALLIAPLPASLTTGHPHIFRAAPVAPIYAALVGIGTGALWRLLRRLPRPASIMLGGGGAIIVALALAWQSSAWLTSMSQRYPSLATSTWFFADGELETMRRVIDYAPGYDGVLLDTSTIGRPYIFLLAAGALPPAQAQAQIVVERQPPAINSITRLGQYAFADLKGTSVPQNLPVVEAVPTRDGGPGYLIQEWQHDDRRVLVVRGMTTQMQNYAGDSDAIDDEP
jgi:4-amino-4-deoxy-L-arabinose transferase-like glycosyltransferase